MIFCNKIRYFFIKKHQQIAKAILELKKDKEEINILSVQNRIKANNTAEVIRYIADLGNNIFGVSIDYAYRELKRLSKKRKLLEISQEIQKDVENESEIEIYIEKKIKELSELNQEGEKEKTFLDLIAETSDMIEKKMQQGAEYDYKYFTGIIDLDKETNGLHEEELTIIGARPGVGKTTLALQIAHYIATKGTTVAIISLEMSETQIVQKLVSKESRISSDKLRTGNLNEFELGKVTDAMIKIGDLPIHINTKIRTIQEIENYARRLKNKNDLGLLVVDYIQLVKSKNKFSSREQEVAEISRNLKLLSLELKIPIIGLCQLNRNAARTEPTLADLRESGAIEQDADNVIFIYKKYESEEPQLAEDIIIDLQKQRAGGLTKVTTRFVKTFSEFRNLTRR